MLDRCINGVTASLHAELPDLGKNIAIDGSDMPAFANGQRFVRKGSPRACTRNRRTRAAGGAAHDKPDGARPRSPQDDHRWVARHGGRISSCRE
jgi:hypothetical protein